jgi:hypothetical protein
MPRGKRNRRARSIVKAAELAAPQVAAIRTARALSAGAHPGAADRAEFPQMGTEKAQAFWESIFAMSEQIVRTNQDYARTTALRFWRLWTTPAWITSSYGPLSQAMASLPHSIGSTFISSQSESDRAVSKTSEAALTPVHKRTAANARRPGRSKKQ